MPAVGREAQESDLSALCLLRTPCQVYSQLESSGKTGKGAEQTRESGPMEFCQFTPAEELASALHNGIYFQDEPGILFLTEELVQRMSTGGVGKMDQRAD